MGNKRNKMKVQFWRRIQRQRQRTLDMTFRNGRRVDPPKVSPPLYLNTPHDVLELCLRVEPTARAVPSLIANSQLRPPSLIADAPMKLWLKQLDCATLEELHRKSVAVCAKSLLLQTRDVHAYRVNRIRELIHRELEHRKKEEKARD